MEPFLKLMRPSVDQTPGTQLSSLGQLPSTTADWWNGLSLLLSNNTELIVFLACLVAIICLSIPAAVVLMYRARQDRLEVEARAKYEISQHELRQQELRLEEAKLAQHPPSEEGKH